MCSCRPLVTADLGLDRHIALGIYSVLLSDIGNATDISAIHRQGRKRRINYEDCNALHIKYSSHIPMYTKALNCYYHITMSVL